MSKARIVRGWLLCAAVSVAWLLWPSLPWLYMVATVAPLFFMCCCAEFCFVCGGTPNTSQYQIELSGFADSDCVDCANLDGTYVVDQVSACRYHFDFTFDPSAQCTTTDCNSFAMRLRLEFVSAGTIQTTLLYYETTQGIGAATERRAQALPTGGVDDLDCANFLDEDGGTFGNVSINLACGGTGSPALPCDDSSVVTLVTTI